MTFPLPMLAPMPREAEALQKAAEALGLSLSDAESERLLAYQALILKWNRVYNLTAVRDPSDMLTHHLLDSLAVLPPLRRHLAGRPARLLDVGSGAGLPGVVLAAMESSLEVVCVDTVGKKASFIQQAAAELKLPNLASRHARVESLDLPAFDLITSRAFSSLADFVQLSRRLLKTGGVWMAMKGKHPQAEIDALPSDVTVFHVEQLVVPGLDAERCLIWMRPAT
jgi:16S rRNA (guanine527-N7)-methyltransferase